MRSSVSLESGWSAAQSAALYRVAEWSGGYFGISDAGTLVAHPSGAAGTSIDLHDVVRGLAGREVTAPIIIRLPGILEHRMTDLRRAFDSAIQDAEYDGGFSCVYPIKVNQERHVCEAIRDFGAELGFGLEVGSKPELIAGLSLTQGFNEMPLVCNGFKDAEYIETVVLASKMGRSIIPVVEQAHELKLLARSAEAHRTLPNFGIRARLTTPGIGRWADSSGSRGKFGLSIGEILHAVDYLRDEGLLKGLTMLHCHVGSQIFDIRTVKYVVSELAHLYVELLRAGAPIDTLDIGGGLGVDYDGSQSAGEGSMNYSIEQYATDVVHRVKAVCDEAGVAHPDIMTESGRALVAHSSVLVCEVIGSRSVPPEPDAGLLAAALAGNEPPQPLLDAYEAFQNRETADEDVLLEAFANAEHALSEAKNLFNLGYMDLRSRAATEELFWSVGTAVLSHFGDALPEHLFDLRDRLADLYFVNLSVFQSLLDSWGIGQVFPIIPLQRLAEQPTRHAILADITCDSDGRVDSFPAEGGPAATLPLHAVGPATGVQPADPYYLGVFLVGAYQETLGDLHNLLGDTHAVHVRAAPNGRWRIETLVEGETVREVLSYVQFDPQEIRARLHRDIEDALETDRIELAEAVRLRRFLDEGLSGYTYLE